MTPNLGNDAYRRTVGLADRSFAAAETSAFFAKTYRWMAVGLALTGLVAYSVANSPAALELVVYNRGLFYGLLFAELGLVFAFSSVAHRVSSFAAAAMFVTYAILNGLTFSVIFLMYTQTSVAQLFFVTAGAFAGLSFVGATTKRDLAPIGRFMIMGLIGLVIASIVNIFVQSGALQFVMSCVGVLVFAGLTAYDTQKLKELYAARGEAGNLALRGALTLYLDFINLFLFLLRLFGTRRN